MRLFHKGQRLVKLVDQKTQREQQALLKLSRRRQDLIEEMEKCDAEILTLAQLIAAQQLHDIEATKADIFAHRRQQALLLHQRQELRLEQSMRAETLMEIEEEMNQCQLQLAVLKRKEMKLTKWTHSVKKEWLQQRETASETELEENITCRPQ